MKDSTDILMDDLILPLGQDSSVVDDGLLYKYIINMLKVQLTEKETIEIAEYLSDLYQSSYRHSYSHISSTIFQNIAMESGDIESELDILKNNSDAIRRYGLTNYQDENVLRGFDKFHDHIALEINRMEDLSHKVKQINSTIDVFKSDFSKKMDDTLKQSKQEIHNLSQDSLKRMKRLRDNIFAQIASILGIFAAIIFVFFGGTQLFSNALEGIHNISTLQEVGVLGFIVTLIGLIMFDLIFMLLYVISVISGNPIGGVIEWENDKGVMGFYEILKKKFPYVIIMNDLFLALLVLMIFLIC